MSVLPVDERLLAAQGMGGCGTRKDAGLLAKSLRGDEKSPLLRQAEAGAIQARGDALRNNPSLPTLVAAEKWNGVLPPTMVPGNSVPFVNVK